MPRIPEILVHGPGTGRRWLHNRGPRWGERDAPRSWGKARGAAGHPCCVRARSRRKVPLSLTRIWREQHPEHRAREGPQAPRCRGWLVAPAHP